MASLHSLPQKSQSHYRYLSLPPRIQRVADACPGRHRGWRPVLSVDWAGDPGRAAHPPRMVEGRRVATEVGAQRARPFSVLIAAPETTIIIF